MPWVATGGPVASKRGVVHDAEPLVLVGFVALNQGGMFMCGITPSEPLRWHPDPEGSYVDVAGTTRSITLTRTARPKTLRAGAEVYITGDFDDHQEGRDWKVLHLMNRGRPVAIWHDVVVDELKRKKSWPPTS